MYHFNGNRFMPSPDVSCHFMWFWKRLTNLKWFSWSMLIYCVKSVMTFGRIQMVSNETGRMMGQCAIFSIVDVVVGAACVWYQYRPDAYNVNDPQMADADSKRQTILPHPTSISQSSVGCQSFRCWLMDSTWITVIARAALSIITAYYILLFSLDEYWIQICHFHMGRR